MIATPLLAATTRHVQKTAGVEQAVARAGAAGARLGGHAARKAAPFVHRALGRATIPTLRHAITGAGAVTGAAAGAATAGEGASMKDRAVRAAKGGVIGGGLVAGAGAISRAKGGPSYLRGVDKSIAARKGQGLVGKSLSERVVEDLGERLGASAGRSVRGATAAATQPVAALVKSPKQQLGGAWREMGRGERVMAGGMGALGAAHELRGTDESTGRKRGLGERGLGAAAAVAGGLTFGRHLPGVGWLPHLVGAGVGEEALRRSAGRVGRGLDSVAARVRGKNSHDAHVPHSALGQ